MFEVEKKYIGKRFGKWKVISYSHNKKYGVSSVLTHFFNCRCKCGTEKAVALTNLRAKHSTRCQRCATITHGLSSHPLYGTWRGMIDRCYNPNSKNYKHYGGRGITICNRWRKSFKNFLVDMGEKPSPDLSIDRMNNDGNYEPGNCRWATATVQNFNKRLPEYDRGTLTAAKVAQLTGYSRERIRQMSRPCNNKKSSLHEFKESLIIAGKRRKIIYKPEVIPYLIERKQQYLAN